MFYRGDRDTVPSSAYGQALDIMEAMGWTWEEFLAQPAPLIEELHIRIVTRTRIQAQAMERLNHG